MLLTIIFHVIFRRKSQRPRTREGYQSSAKPPKVEPYTLPPLPTPIEDKIEVTTESMHRTEKQRDPLKELRNKNPWHKPKIVQHNKAENQNYGKKLFGKKTRLVSFKIK